MSLKLILLIVFLGLSDISFTIYDNFNTAFQVLATEVHPHNDRTIHTDLIPDRREGGATIPEGLPIEFLSLLSNATNRQNGRNIHTDLIQDRREVESRSVNSCRCARRFITHNRWLGPQRLVPTKYEYSYHVYFQANDNGYNCGGTIINKRYVVTAMHCLYDDAGNEHPASKTSIIAGEPERPWNRLNEGGQRIAVDYFIKRSDWDNITYANDIAILKLKSDIKFTDNVKPACLPTDSTKMYAGHWAMVTGWGGTVGYAFEERHVVTQKLSDNLKMTSVKISGRRKCRQVAYYDFNREMCAFKSETGPYQGDSGSGLTVTEKGKYILIGVVSSGYGCADISPGMYTRVTHYLSWISRNIQDGEC